MRFQSPSSSSSLFDFSSPVQGKCRCRVFTMGVERGLGGNVNVPSILDRMNELSLRPIGMYDRDDLRVMGNHSSDQGSAVLDSKSVQEKSEEVGQRDPFSGSKQIPNLLPIQTKGGKAVLVRPLG